MSDRPCNLCQLAHLLEEAVKQQAPMTIIPKPGPRGHFPLGVEVQVAGLFRSWFAEVPTRCAC